MKTSVDLFCEISKSYFVLTSFQQIYIPNSIKVALGIGQLRIGKIVWWSLNQSIALCSACPNAQFLKQPLLSYVYNK